MGPGYPQGGNDNGRRRAQGLDSICAQQKIGRRDDVTPVTALADRFGRVATDLRVSLTDRCNLRCTYCMPEEGLAWLPREEQLTDDEVGRLVRIGVTLLGITQVRFTGGEPLLRRGLLGIVRSAASLTPRPRLMLTTNGI